MLSRPEIGTKAHVTLWLNSKPADEAYAWHSPECPAGQYMAEFGADQWGAVRELHQIAHAQPHTWGALIDRVQVNA